MKKHKKTIMIIAIVMIGVPLFLYDGLHGNFIRDYLMEKRVKEHLLSEGFQNEEIASIEAKYNMKMNTDRVKGTVADVVFKDEPEEVYLYIELRKSGEIRQECSYYNEDTNAIEVEYTKERKYMKEDCY